MYFFPLKLFDRLKFPFNVPYVDECFVLIDQNPPDMPFSKCYEFQCTQFTYEIENNNRLPFLDVLLGNNGEKCITTVNRKHFAVYILIEFLHIHQMTVDCY